MKNQDCITFDQSCPHCGYSNEVMFSAPIRQCFNCKNTFRVIKREDKPKGLYENIGHIDDGRCPGSPKVYGSYPLRLTVPSGETEITVTPKIDGIPTTKYVLTVYKPVSSGQYVALVEFTAKGTYSVTWKLI